MTYNIGEKKDGKLIVEFKLNADEWEAEVQKAFGYKETKTPVQKNIKNRDCNIQQIISAAESEVIKTQMKIIETKLDLIIQMLKGRQ